MDFIPPDSKGFYALIEGDAGPNAHVPPAWEKHGPFDNRLDAETYLLNGQRAGRRTHLEEIADDGPWAVAYRRLSELNVRARQALEGAVGAGPRARRLADWAQRIEDMLARTRSGNVSPPHEIDDAQRNLETAIQQLQAE